QIAAGLAVGPAIAAPWGVTAALADQAEAGRRQRLDLSHQPVAATSSAAAAAVAAQRELADTQGELGLQRLDRRVEGVRHRHVDGARSLGVGAGALAAAEGLVIGEPLAGEREVVHRALALSRRCRRLAERRDDEIGHAARRLDVAGGYGGGRLGVEQA